MKKLLFPAAAATCLVLSSCVDPYYGGSAGYSTSYNSGYNSGYGSYGGGGYSSSIFVSTGNPRWSYDPYRYCYYDRYRSSYYDPYLNGYYPVGYQPIPVRGVPHPHNWRGSGNCAPPSIVNTHNLNHYDDRVRNYSNSNFQWSRKVTSGGSPSWMNESQRKQLHDRAAVNPQNPRSQPNQGFGSMGGGSNQPFQPGRQPNSPNIQQPGGGSGWGGQPPRNNSQQQIPRQPMPPTVVNQTPDIKPRNTTGGVFEGIDRSSRNSRSNSQNISPQARRSIAPSNAPPRQVQPQRAEPQPQPQPQRGSNDDGEVKKSSGKSMRGFFR